MMSPELRMTPRHARARLSQIVCNELYLPNLTRRGWEAVRKLNELDPLLFDRDRQIVRVGKHRHDQGPVLERANLPIFRNFAAQAAHWVHVSQTKMGEVVTEIAPPIVVLENMLAERERPLPPLIGLWGDLPVLKKPKGSSMTR